MSRHREAARLRRTRPVAKPPVGTPHNRKSCADWMPSRPTVTTPVRPCWHSTGEASPHAQIPRRRAFCHNPEARKTTDAISDATRAHPKCLDFGIRAITRAGYVDWRDPESGRRPVVPDAPSLPEAVASLSQTEGRLAFAPAARHPEQEKQAWYYEGCAAVHSR